MKVKIESILLFAQVHDVLGTDVSDLKELPGTIRSILLLLPKDEKYQEILEEKKAAAGVRYKHFKVTK